MHFVNDYVICRPWSGIRAPFEGYIVAILNGAAGRRYMIHPTDIDTPTYEAFENEVSDAAA